MNKGRSPPGATGPAARLGAEHGPGSVLRPLYRGEIVWNQTRKRDCWDSRSARTGDWLRVAAPDLQIVPDDLWTAAQARFAERQQKHEGERAGIATSSRRTCW